jgi:hypothetical protein
MLFWALSAFLLNFRPSPHVSFTFEWTTPEIIYSTRLPPLRRSPEKRVKNVFLSVQFFPFKDWQRAGLKSKLRRN